jgi:hypothetical protein
VYPALTKNELANLDSSQLPQTPMRFQPDSAFLSWLVDFKRNEFSQ